MSSFGANSSSTQKKGGLSIPPLNNNNNSNNSKTSLAMAGKENGPQQQPIIRSSPLSSSPLIPRSSPAAASATAHRRGVLRYGETMESLFCIDDAAAAAACATKNNSLSSPSDKQEYVELCRSVVEINTSSSENAQQLSAREARAWRRILQLYPGPNVVRLHRRATSRLTTSSCSSTGSTTGSTNDATQYHEDVLHIWLSFAAAQHSAGHAKDAQMTLQHVRLQTHLGYQQSAAYYLLVATMLNNNNEQAAQVLREGIARQAQPLGDLRAALSNLTAKTKKASLSLQQPQQQQQQHHPLQGNKQMSSPKRRKTETGFVELQANGSAVAATAQNSNRHKTATASNVATRNNDGETQFSQDSNMELDDDDDSGCSASPTSSLEQTKDSSGSSSNTSNNSTLAAAADTKESIRFQLAPLRKMALPAEHQLLPSQNNSSGAAAPKSAAPTLQKRPQHSLQVESSSSNLKKEAPKKESRQQTIADTSNSSATAAAPWNNNRQSSHLGGSSSNTEEAAKKRNATALEPKKRSRSLQQKTERNSDALLTISREASERPRLSGGGGGGGDLDATPKRSSLSRAPLLLSNSHKSGVLGGPGRSSHRPPLQLKAFGLLGKAERVDPSQSVLESESESECDGTPAPQAASSLTASLSANKKTPMKFKKQDLDYMFNWDPDKRNNSGSATPATQTSSSLKASHSKGLAKIEEQTPSVSSSNASSALRAAAPLTGTTTNAATGQTVNKSADSSAATTEAVNHKTPSRGGRRQQSLGGTPTDGHNNTKSEQLARANLDFLPLVSEDNIIRVKNVPYVKLGIIGKGGSCKVYRALSKDCSVVAIKKVKLENLDKKAIDGYANEIALLKRLRGNPSIIQMFDSEVALSRNSIFLVMEPGEADLSQVLQKQAQEHRLDMNFIRLTWQQMLRAVHSIHEERIIHGDLKPANFLFVRGSLKLIDFGIAKAIQSEDTTNIYRESQIGTLSYMSPESIIDSGTSTAGARMKCGRPSDIWSLGCILYQMVYGRTPFAELHMIQKLQAIVNPAHKIAFPDTADRSAIDAMKQCLCRKADDRAPIVGPNGLLNEHVFLNASSQSRQHAR